MSAIGFHPHNHDSCIQTGVSAAAETCAAEGLQLTDVRRRVLEILLEKHRALGAYDILEMLRAEGMGSQPPVAYRALAFLTKHGFAHKIERLNKFVACSDIGGNHTPAFLICTGCDQVAEAHLEASAGRLSKAADAVGFTIERAVLEAEGLCQSCREAAA
ncbi:Fur family transcriptional regulator [Cognatishimia sp. MH4019]|uniref:Fur family transcriptional regulator n=1 Tax=Cognatishimia sp. MH4019 TaxID=2854030 RepID=UPI001CD48A19|nr:transcriptional repressor [Cognatishimia sp. MH4019]